MNPDDFETSAVFHELIDELRGLEPKLFDGPNAPQDEQSVLEGYKWIFSILQVTVELNSGVQIRVGRSVSSSES